MPIPTSWLGVIFFLVLLAPGLFHGWLAERRRANPPLSTFQEAGRVVLVSIVLDLVAFVTLMLVQVVRPDWVPDPAGLLRGGAAYVADHYNLVLRTIALHAAITTLAVLAMHRVLVARQRGDRTEQVSGWARLFRTERPDGTVPYARIKMPNGTTYGGTVVYYTSDHALGDREIVLGPPLTAKPKDGTAKDLPEHYQRIWVRADEIDSMTISYVPSPDANGKSTKQRAKHSRRGGPFQAVHPRRSPEETDRTTAAEAG